jgi:hypothetical protein
VASFLRRHRGWLIGQAVLWVAVVAVLRAAVVPAERCPPATPASVEAGIDAGTAWLVRGQRPDGRYMYGFHRDTGTVATGYNTTRHAGVMDALYRTGHVRSADAGLAWARSNLMGRDGWTALAPPGEQANVGADALLVVALLHRRQATGDRRWDGLARRLSRFIASQTQADGSVLQYWDARTGAPVPGRHGIYSTGEAFFALALMARTFPGEGWEAPAHRIVGYISTRRDRAEGNAYRPSDHWAAYGLEALAAADRLTPAERDYARWLAGYFGWLVRYESQHVGRSLSFSGSGASLGTVGEGTAALGRLAAADPALADLRAPLAERSVCLGGILLDRQAIGAADPRERGAWFDGGDTQMDDQQHAVAALIGTREALR